MRNIAVLTVVALAALVVVMAHAGPAYAAQTSVAVSNSGTVVDMVVGTQSTVPAQLVMRGHGGGRVAFRSGGFRSFRAARFNRFNRVHFRHNRFFRPFLFGSVAVPYAYSSYYNSCVWDGYQWVCPDDLY
ncbi:MAG: hypothetical protein ACLP5H_10965 [Desulfomonilaceae bacterium]